MMNHLEIKNQSHHKNAVKINKDLDRMLQNSTDEQLINHILI